MKRNSLSARMHGGAVIAGVAAVLGGEKTGPGVSRRRSSSTDWWWPRRTPPGCFGWRITTWC